MARKRGKIDNRNEVDKVMLLYKTVQEAMIEKLKQGAYRTAKQFQV